MSRVVIIGNGPDKGIIIDGDKLEYVRRIEVMVTPDGVPLVKIEMLAPQLIVDLDDADVDVERHEAPGTSLRQLVHYAAPGTLVCGGCSETAFGTSQPLASDLRAVTCGLCLIRADKLCVTTNPATGLNCTLVMNHFGSHLAHCGKSMWAEEWSDVHAKLGMKCANLGTEAADWRDVTCEDCLRRYIGPACIEPGCDRPYRHSGRCTHRSANRQMQEELREPHTPIDGAMKLLIGQSISQDTPGA